MATGRCHLELKHDNTKSFCGPSVRGNGRCHLGVCVEALLRATLAHYRHFNEGWVRNAGFQPYIQAFNAVPDSMFRVIGTMLD